jgi:hypothetical protein
MSERNIGNNEKRARRKGGVFIYVLIQLIPVVAVIVMPEDQIYQHIIPVNTSCIANPIHKMISIC